MPPEWPAWWDWELELSPHLLKRMVDREFSEVDIRRMLELARGLSADLEDGRWRIDSYHQGRPWRVVVEPDPADRLIVVITAFPLESVR